MKRCEILDSNSCSEFFRAGFNEPVGQADHLPLMILSIPGRTLKKLPRPTIDWGQWQRVWLHADRHWH
jgi:hypothetical protein